MSARPVLISIAVHGALIAAIVLTAREYGQSKELGFYGNTPPDSVGGTGGLAGLKKAALPLGRSVSPDEAKPYLGRYVITTPGKPDAEMIIAHAHDGEGHWSLLVDEGNRYPYVLIPLERDTFAYQLSPTRRIVFVRRDSAVVAIELHSGGDIRRGAKVLTP